MNTNIKRQHTPEFKTSVVLEVLKENETISQICSRYSIHPTQVRRWKEHVLAIVNQSFNGKTINEQLGENETLISELYRQIGQLKVELDWLKKKMGYTLN